MRYNWRKNDTFLFFSKQPDRVLSEEIRRWFTADVRMSRMIWKVSAHWQLGV